MSNARRSRGRTALALSLMLAWLPFDLHAGAQQTAAAEAADNFAETQTAAALKNLSPRSQKVIERLSTLNSLPLTGWRWHIGDIAHGEALGLDDSSWPAIKTPYQTNTTDTIWLRTWIEVPKTVSGYDLNGARIWTKSVKDSAVTVYLNGQRVASGEDLEPIVLFDKAKPGERALLAVRIEHSDDPQMLPEATLRIEAAPDRPSPEALYTEFVSAALLIPNLGINVQGNQATLEQAIGDVDLAALETGESIAIRPLAAPGGERSAADRANAALRDIPPDGERAYRCGVAMAVDRDRRCGAPHLWHGAAADGRVPDIYLHTIGIAVQRVDRG